MTAPSIQSLVDDIEDYIGGSVEGIDIIDRMALTVFLRAALTSAHAAGQEAMRGRAAKLAEYSGPHDGTLIRDRITSLEIER